MSDFQLAEMAEYNLRRFVGTTATRDMAEKAFPMWEFYEYLTRQTREAVLASFPEPVELVENPDFYAEEPSSMVVGCSPALKAVAR